MPIASFGKKVFSVSLNRVYTFNGYTRTSALSVEEQEVAGSKPSSYIKGSALDDLGITIELKKMKGIDVRKEINEWMAIKDSKTPENFILGGSRVGANKYLLVSVGESDVLIDNQGRVLSAKIDLKFKEFVRLGKKEEKPKTSKDDKSKNKRKNSNSKKSKDKGKKTSDKKKSSNKKSGSSSKRSSSAASNKKVEALEKEIFGK
ncbi:phage tail protein [Clostridium cylindrosporum]|uniref:Uncharacterized protein n=1 Tax=Clostridium cylindrosporum DSM 605 TaxID=1121307 RepID=A0A0J8DFL5_CLOCY|nr:phage tail protein [Clostridium cylindrosporum]KMT23014.1 hypothetical protein CLCY_7c00610 [Clostridium cylindrosporum DSM 605]